ncbi:hypothetical protein J0H58_07055 [bacterium]|nr:hypothetical protein [bacterium]
MTVAAPECRPALPADVVISGELTPGEHLIWTGRPPRGLNLRQEDWNNAIRATALHAVEAVLLGNFGGPLVVLFNGVTTGAVAAGFLDRIAFQPHRRRQTWYGLTAERVVIAEMVRNEIQVRSTRLADVGIGRLTERADGSGVIDLYRPARSWFERRMKRAESPVGHLARLDLAADARRVYNLIREARRAVIEVVTVPTRGPHTDRSPVLVESG